MLSEIVWDQDKLIIVGMIAFGAIVSVAIIWYQIERMKSENDLKRSMVERGMSADEIVRVISCRTPKAGAFAAELKVKQ